MGVVVGGDLVEPGSVAVHQRARPARLEFQDRSKVIGHADSAELSLADITG
jgi:hypothetical protein